MGIPGMLGALNKRDVFTQKKHLHQANGEVGPCLVFDTFTLPQLIKREWKRQPTGTPATGPVAYDSSTGGWVTRLRKFAICYLKQLVEEYHCTIVWVRDGGANDKPNTINDSVFDDIAQGCNDADAAIKSTGITAKRDTLDIVSELLWPMKGFSPTNNAVSEALAACGEGVWRDQFRVVIAAAKSTDGEVWRQAIKLLDRYQKERSMFIVSCDTDMLFFRGSSPEVGVVLMSSYAMEHEGDDKPPVIGARWSCDLRREVASHSKLLSFTYCTTTDDVAHALGVEPELLPVLAACLGGDLSTDDPSIYNLTVGIKSALVEKHFEDGSGVAEAFKHLANEDEHALNQTLRRQSFRNGRRACSYGKYCRRSNCDYTHPREGRMWCSKEKIPGRQCSRLDCRCRHAAPMAFELAPYILKKFGKASNFPHGAIFPTWREGVEALSEMQEESRQSCLGVRVKIPIGNGLRGTKDLRRIIFEESINLVRTKGRCWTTDSGEIDVDVCVRDLCEWLCTVSGRDEHDVSEALTRAIRVYDMPSLDEDALPVVVSTYTLRSRFSVVRRSSVVAIVWP